MRIRNGSTLWAIALLLSGCASSFVSSWTAPDAAPLQIKGSKVAAIVMMKNEPSRRTAEDSLARELTARGATGVPLYIAVPNATADNEAAVRAELEKAGFAGAVVMRPIGTEKEAESKPVAYAGPTYTGFWGGYYGYGWHDPWTYDVVGGDIRTNTIVSVETLVYSLKQNKLVWGGQSKTTNPSNLDWLVKDTAARVASELKRLGLLDG
jgi:hypothetical protein